MSGDPVKWNGMSNSLLNALVQPEAVTAAEGTLAAVVLTTLAHPPQADGLLISIHAKLG